MTTNYQENKSRQGYEDQKKSHSISETLKMLDDAAIESSSGIKQMGRESLAYLAQAKDKVVETSKDAARKVDQSAHNNPWYYVGATAAVVGVTGFFLGRKSKSII